MVINRLIKTNKRKVSVREILKSLVSVFIAVGFSKVSNKLIELLMKKLIIVIKV